VRVARSPLRAQAAVADNPRFHPAVHAPHTLRLTRWLLLLLLRFHV